MAVNPGRAITEYHVAETVHQAYARAKTVQNAIRVFKITGIWPFNSQILPDEEFAPAQTTERPLEIEIINLDIPGRPWIFYSLNNRQIMQCL